MVLVEKFFCFDLYTTGLLIGWLGLAESIISCIFSLVMLENVDAMITPENFPDIDDIKPIQKTFVTMLSAYIAFNIIDLLASGLLITGTVKRNRLLLLPWLINSLISLMFNATAIAITLYVSLSSKSANYTAVIPFIVTSVVVFGIYVYAYLAIQSLYQLIRRTTPNSEYSSLIDGRPTGYPIYTRC